MTTQESLTGYYRVELSSGNVARFLDSATQKGMELRDVSWENDLTIRFSISRIGYKKLNVLAQKQGAELKILSRQGIYWNAMALWKRPVFLIGMLFMLVMGIFFPGRIYFLEVRGNHHVERARILEAASEFGIRCGASRRLVRSEQVKNQLIGAIPNLEWVGVNTKGCVAVISVREKVLETPVLGEAEPCDIVALRDGIILDCSATRGTLLCTVGQAVSQGDLLISGRGSLLNVDTVTGASGEIFAATQRQISVSTPGFALTREAEQVRRVNWSLQIGKNLINFLKGSGISGGSCVKMYSKYVLTLPGGFTLPVALIKWTTVTCDVVSKETPEDEAQRLLSEFASSYLEMQMIAGRMIRKFESVAHPEGIYQLTGDYACTEMIGRVQKEQIGAYHGKTD